MLGDGCALRPGSPGHRASEHERARRAGARPRPGVAAARDRHDRRRHVGDAARSGSASGVSLPAQAVPARAPSSTWSTRPATPAAALSIEVISAKPEWLELVAPCTLEMADRIQSFVLHLEANLPEAVREAVASAFRELLTNAIEWGGKLDPNRKVRISCVRTKRLLLYRIADPGEGFDIDKLRHAAITNPDDDPMRHLSSSRGAGTSARRVRPRDDAFARGRSDLQRSAQRGAAHQVPGRGRIGSWARECGSSNGASATSRFSS